MEKSDKETQTFFLNLSKKDQKLLYKEFNKNAEKFLKISLWIGLGLIPFSLISGGFSVYYIVNIFLKNIIKVELYICAFVFTFGCGLSLLLTTRYQKKFRLWLKERNIIYNKE